MKVILSRAAEQYLGKLFSYISNELQNPIAAKNIATKILLRAQSLANFPKTGTGLEDADHRLKGYRYLLIDNYLIIYKITEQVSVLRILYARSDYTQLLRS